MNDIIREWDENTLIIRLIQPNEKELEKCWELSDEIYDSFNVGYETIIFEKELTGVEFQFILYNQDFKTPEELKIKMKIMEWIRSFYE